MIAVDLGLEQSFFNSADNRRVWPAATPRPPACGQRTRIIDMNIHQVSVNYAPEQDRLLIRINGREGGELRAWLTRRLALALWPVLSQTAAAQMTKLAGPAAPAASLDEQRDQLLDTFQKEALLRTGDFKTPYKDRQGQPANAVLGPEPLLLTEVKVTLMGSGQVRLQMLEKLPGSDTVRNFQVMMDAQLTNGLLHLLHQSLNASQWLEPVASASLKPANSSEVPELAMEPAKPRYLN